MSEPLKFSGSFSNANCALRTLRRMLQKAERSREIFCDIVVLMRDTGMRNERELYRMRIEKLGLGKPADLRRNVRNLLFKDALAPFLLWAECPKWNDLGTDRFLAFRLWFLPSREPEKR